MEIRVQRLGRESGTGSGTGERIRAKVAWRRDQKGASTLNMEPSKGELGNRDKSPQAHPHCAELPPVPLLLPSINWACSLAQLLPSNLAQSGLRVDRVGRWPPAMRTGSPWRRTFGPWSLGSSWRGFSIGGSELGSNMSSANHLASWGGRHWRAIIQSLDERHQVTYVGPETRLPVRCSLCTAYMVIPNFRCPPAGC